VHFPNSFKSLLAVTDTLSLSLRLSKSLPALTLFSSDTDCKQWQASKSKDRTAQSAINNYNKSAAVSKEKLQGRELQVIHNLWRLSSDSEILKLIQSHHGVHRHGESAITLDHLALKQWAPGCSLEVVEEGKDPANWVAIMGLPMTEECSAIWVRRPSYESERGRLTTCTHQASDSGRGI
jgi:hypothetical protein